MPLTEVQLADLADSATNALGEPGGLQDGFTIRGDAFSANGQFGWSVTGIGDFDGDTYADFMIGAPASNGSAGAVYIVYGTDATTPGNTFGGDPLDAPFSGPLTDPSIFDLSELTAGTHYTRIEGVSGVSSPFDTSGDLLGFSVSEVGYFDEEDPLDPANANYSDVIFSAPGVDGEGFFNHDIGATYVLYGEPGRPATIDVTQIGSGAPGAPDGVILDGSTFANQLGASVANLGDINGDGQNDFMVGAPGANAGGVDSGEGYVIYGNPVGGVPADIDLFDMAPSVGFTVRGGAGDLVGPTVSAAGDMNNDGIDDFLIASPDGADGAGEIYLIWGRDFENGSFSADPATPFNIDLDRLTVDNLGVKFTGVYATESGDRAGTSIASGGDVNGDGIDDLIIGAPRANDGVGGVYIVYGQDMSAADADVNAGYGDTGDGVLGGTWDDSALYGAGGTWSRTVDLGKISADQGTFIAGDFDDRQFGHDVYMVGDLDRDGIEDLVIGSPGSSDADGGGLFAGAVYIVRGREDWDFAFTDQAFSPINAFDADDGWELVGVDAFDTAGWSVGVVGDFATGDGVVVHDLNDDDTLDLIIGAPSAEGGDGEVYVFFTPIAFAVQDWDDNDNNGFDGILQADGTEHIGTPANDSINALGGDDVVLARGLRDIVNGGDGDDLIFGGSHSDTLFGDAGDDIIYGDPDGAQESTLGGPSDINDPEYFVNDERDTLFGGDGTDTLFGGTEVDSLFGGDGVDRIFGGTGDDVAFGGGGIDFLRGGAGDDTIEGDDGNDRIFGEDGDDTLIGELGNDRIFGGAGADTINGGAGQDTIEGGAGADTIDGGAARDRIFGGGGIDTIDGGAGADTIFGGGAADTINGGAARDTIFGGGDNDTIFGQGGLDTLRGGGGDDEIFGGGGADDLFGAAGDDQLFGGAGADELRGGMDNDTLNGGGGDDLLLGQIGDDTLTGGGGDDELRGGGGADTLIGNAGADLMFGQGGEDSLFGGNGEDEMYGGGGRDTLRGGNQDDFLNGGGGRDRLFGGGGDDSVVGGNGNDVVRGNMGDDTLVGGNGRDRLLGDAGEDTLFGGVGDDRLQGGADNDSLVGGAGADNIDGEAGDDQLRVDSFDINIQGGTGTDTAFVDGPGGVTLDVTNSIETAFGADGVDVFNYAGVATAVRFEGGDGDDQLTGGTLNDSLVGGDGADELFGGAGDDYFRIDEFDTAVFGGAGIDTLEVETGGGAGVTVLAASSIEVATGSIFNDEFSYAAANTTNVTYAGEGGADILRGGAGDDQLFGGDGNDELRGRNGVDSLFGGAGVDQLFAGNGADTLAGGAGAGDSLDGGGGADVFILTAGDGLDTIFGFQDGIDQIDITDFGLGAAPAAIDVAGNAFLDINGTDGFLLIGFNAADLDTEILF